MQGQFGAMLPAVNTGGGQDPLSINRLGAPVMQGLRSFFPLSPLLAQPGSRNDDFALRQAQQNGGLPAPAAVTGQQQGAEWAKSHPQAGDQSGTDDFYLRKQAILGDVLAAVESGDLSALKYLPADDLEAMFPGMDLVGAGTGVGTGVDEGKDMTPAQLEERYYRNREVEAKFLGGQRWNSQKRKFESVAKWMKNERKKYNKKGRRKDSPRQQQAAPKKKNPQYTVQQQGGTNFNTATG